MVEIERLSQVHNLERMPSLKAKMWTSVFIIHRPYFQHPNTNCLWTQDQVFKWLTTPHPSILEQEDRVHKELYNFLYDFSHLPRSTT